MEPLKLMKAMLALNLGVAATYGGGHYYAVMNGKQGSAKLKNWICHIQELSSADGKQTLRRPWRYLTAQATEMDMHKLEKQQ